MPPFTFIRLFDFVYFNTLLIKLKCGKELIAAFDPTFIAKSGTKTPGLSKWWSGTHQCALKGLEIGCLSIVDMQAATAMSPEQCQVRGENKLYFHFNMALGAVSAAKAVTWLSLAKEKRQSFSIRNIKVMFYNKLMTETILSNLGLELRCKKVNRLYQQCLNISALAA